jgi:LPS-assembly protein
MSSADPRTDRRVQGGRDRNLLFVLHEGGRLAAKSAQRDDAGNMVLRGGAYTGCDVVDSDNCRAIPAGNHAVRITYRASDKMVRYYGAKLRVFGIPLPPARTATRTSAAPAACSFPTSASARRTAPRSAAPITGALPTTRTSRLPVRSLPGPADDHRRYRQLTSNGAFQVWLPHRSRQNDATTDANGSTVTVGNSNTTGVAISRRTAASSSTRSGA